MASQRPLPTPDRDSLPWWEALARHELVLQRCTGCRAWRWPPREICARCGSLAWEWQPASGRGTIVSWIVNRHSFGPAFESPYVVVYVRLDEQDDILMPGAFAGHRDGTGLAIGAPVTVEFDDVGPGDDPGDGPAGTTLLRWRLAG